jgi:O-antigen/teichoic acid export membrane protein
MDTQYQSKPFSGRSLPHNTAWAATGNVFFAGGRFLVLVLLWKFLPSVQVGQALLALAIVTPLSFFLNLGFRLVIVTDTNNRFAPGYCLTTRLCSNLVLGLVLVSLCGIQYDNWDVEKMAVILLAGAVRAVESWADIYLAVLQKHERMKNVSISQILKVSLVLICAAAFAPLTQKAIWIFLGWAIAVLVISLFYDRPRAGRFESVSLRWDKHISSQLIRLGFPLGVFITITSFNERVCLYFIEHDFGDQYVAYFSTFLAFIAGLSAVQNGVNQAVLPRLSHYYQQSRKDFIKLLGQVLLGSWAVMGCFLLGVWWHGELILRIVAKSEYAQYADVFVVVAAGGCLLFTGMILGDAVVACRRFRSRTLAVALGFIVNILICWFYIPTYDLSAAAWAMVVSSALTSATCGAFLWYALRKKAA